MTSHYDPLKHHRRSIRLMGYDYSRAGAYFVTAVTRGRLCLYGETDAYVVMPNHFHGIIVIAEDAAVAGASTQPGLDPTDPEQAALSSAPQLRAPLSDAIGECALTVRHVAPTLETC